MGQITDIQPGKRNPTRVNIYLDGKFAFAISHESKIINKLKVNDLLSEDKIQELIFNDQVERLYEKAIKFLSYRPRSEKEVSDNLLRKLKLTDKGEDEKKNFQKSIDKVLEKLKKLELLNDIEFTKWWVEQRTKFKKTAPRLIKVELFKKGISKEIIEEIFEKTEIDPFELALSSGRKKLNSYKNFDNKTFREKMSRFLASHGFDWEIVKRVVDTLSKEV